MTQRNHAIDVVRAIALIAIVVGHIWDRPEVRLALYTWHVPVFFFLTGYLWRSGRSIEDEVRKRAASLLKPYVFWWIVIFASWCLVAMAMHDFEARAAVGAIYGGIAAARPFTTFWFVFVLFASSVLWRALEKAPLTVRVAVVLLALVAAVWAGPLLARTPLAIGTALPAILFVGAGVLARRLTPDRTSMQALWGVGLFSLAVVLVVGGWAAPFDIKQGNWGTPLVSVFAAVLISFALVLLASSVSQWLGFIGVAATEFALCGFTVVLVHPAMLSLFEGRLPPALLLIVAIAIPTLIAGVALRTRWSQWLTGIPARTVSWSVRRGRTFT